MDTHTSTHYYESPFTGSTLCGRDVMRLNEHDLVTVTLRCVTCQKCRNAYMAKTKQPPVD